MEVSSFKYEAKKRPGGLFFIAWAWWLFSFFELCLGLGFFWGRGGLWVFIGLVWLVWFGFWGVCGGVAYFLVLFFLYNVSENGTHNSTTGQFSHKENVSS